MSDLQIGLLGIGALVVAGVLVYNRVQERNARRAAERAFGSSHADALMQAPAATADPAIGGSAPRAAARSEPPKPAQEAQPDPSIDYVIELSLPRPAPAHEIRDQWAAIERRHARRALLAASPEGTLWRAGLQLVNREGPVGEADLIEFRSSVETLAAALGASIEAPEMRAAVEAARALDDFCAEADIQVVVHVVAPAGAAFAGTKVRAAAEAQGLALEPDGRFVLRDEENRALYTLANRDAPAFSAAWMREASPQALTLALEVARAPHTRRTFEAMARFAHQLEAALGGRLVDDNGNALDERAVAAIAQQLEGVRASLEARGVAPGSAAALRLFG